MTDVEGQRGIDGPAVAAPWVPLEGGARSPRVEPTATTADGALGGPARPVAAPPPSPVPLRPVGSSGIYDGAFEVLKVRPKVLLGSAAAVVVPVQAAATLLRGGPYHHDLLTVLVATIDGDARAEAALGLGGAGSAAGSLVGGLLEMVATFLVGVLVAGTVAAWYAGADPGVRPVLRDALRRPVALLVAFVVMALAQTAGALVLCVGIVLPLTWFSVLAPVIGVERLGAGDALRRSYALVNRRFLAVAGLVLGMTLIDQLVRFALVALPWMLADGLPDVAATGVRVAATTVAATISAVFVAASCTLVYFDLRVRSEGLDIELEATDAFASLR